MRFFYFFIMASIIGQATDLYSKNHPSKLQTIIAETRDLSHKTFEIPCFESDKNTCVNESIKSFSARTYFDRQNKLNIFSCQVDPKQDIKCQVEDQNNSLASISGANTGKSCTIVSSNCIQPTIQKNTKTKVAIKKCSLGYKGLYAKVEQAAGESSVFRNILVACISEESYASQANAKTRKLALE